MKKQLLSEVKHFQKIAGLLKESFDRDAPESNTYEDVRDWLDNLYPDASQYPDFLTDFKKELQFLTPEERNEWITKFKRDFGEDLNENWHPDDPASVDVDDIEDKDPEDFDDISEERGYRADKDPEVLYKVKDLVKSMVNRFGKSSITIGSPEWNKLVSSLEALFERLRVNIDSSEFFGDTLLDILQDLQVDINHGDNISEDDDYDESSDSESGNTDAMGGINEIGGGFKFKVGDVVNSKVNKGNKLVILMAFPNLEAATKYDERDKPDFWESAIVRGEIAPVSKDVANKPWYLAWTREVKGEDLVMCDPEEFLSK